MRSMVVISQKGDFEKTTRFFKKIQELRHLDLLEYYGAEGVKALSAATPVRTGKTADSWSYEITKNANGYTLSWLNSNTNRGVSIAILNQYGHATRDGGWVEGIDYINPALRPIFEKMADDLWREVTD